MLRRELTYSHAFHRIIGGLAELGVCMFNTIWDNKILTALVLSTVANCILTLSLIRERAQNDSISAEVMRLEILNDSLSGKSTNISFAYR